MSKLEESTTLSSLLYTEASEECEKATFEDLTVEDPEEEEAVAALKKAEVGAETGAKAYEHTMSITKGCAKTAHKARFHRFKG